MYSVVDCFIAFFTGLPIECASVELCTVRYVRTHPLQTRVPCRHLSKLHDILLSVKVAECRRLFEDFKAALLGKCAHLQ